MSPPEQIDSLKAEVAWLKGIISAQSSNLPLAWGLTSAESKVMGALLARDIAPVGSLISAVYWDRDEPESPEASLHVMISKMRRKLAAFGIAILPQWGVGYRLDPPRKAIVLRELGGTT